MKLASRIGWAVVVAGTALLIAAAAGVERRLGGGRAPRLSFDVFVPAPRAGGDEPAEVARALAARLRDRTPDVRPGQSPQQLVVTADGAADEVEVVRGLLTRAGLLELYEVVSDTAVARDWYQAARDHALAADVDAQADSWTNDRTGEAFHDYYLTAPTGEVLDAALARLAPVPDGLRVLVERIAPHPDGDDERPPYLRTYLVRAEPALDGRHVATADVTFDQHTLRPEVVLRFTGEGRRRFGDLTRAITGRKLAIVLDGVVASAPVVQTAITGGVSTITMGGSDARRMEQEANALVHVLRTRATLPAGMQASLREAIPGVKGRTWLPRAVVALVAGALAFFLAPILARRAAAPAAPLARGTAGAGRTALAAALTVGAPLLLIVLARWHALALPWANAEELEALAGGGRLGPAIAPEHVSVFALGVMPLVSGFWLAEAIAVLVPRWRAVRTGPAGARGELDRVALTLGLLFALLQGRAALDFLHGFGGPGYRLMVDSSASVIAVQTLTLVAGVAVHALVADVVTRHGLCNGYHALIGVGAAHTLVDALRQPPPVGVPDPRVAVAALVAALALAGLIASSLRDTSAARRRLPWVGILPVAALSIAGGLAVLVLVQGPTLFGEPGRGGSWLGHLVSPSRWFDVAFALAATAVLVAARGGRELVASRLGVAVTAGLVVAILLVRHLAPAWLLVNAWLLTAFFLLAFLADGAGALLARLGLAAPQAILAVHDVDRADRAADALAAAGIPAAVENLRLRALLRGLGGFAPIVIRVDRADVERARAAIADAEAARDPLVAPFVG
jgi:hypothetical protein